MAYKDEKGHFTDKAHDGGKCTHDGFDETTEADFETKNDGGFDGDLDGEIEKAYGKYGGDKEKILKSISPFKYGVGEDELRDYVEKQVGYMKTIDDRKEGRRLYGEWIKEIDDALARGAGKDEIASINEKMKTAMGLMDR